MGDERLDASMNRVDILNQIAPLAQQGDSQLGCMSSVSPGNLEFGFVGTQLNEEVIRNKDSSRSKRGDVVQPRLDWIVLNPSGVQQHFGKQILVGTQ